MATPGVLGEAEVEFAVPTLKVMRLQKPELHMVSLSKDRYSSIIMHYKLVENRMRQFIIY